MSIRIVLILSFLIHFSAIAQKVPKNLKQLEASRQEIEAYQKRMQESNLSIEQFESSLYKQGLNQAEVDKIVQGIRASNGTNTSSVKTEPRELPKKDYQTSEKPPLPNIFGSSFFNTQSLSFEPNLRIATPSSYVLGPDDELQISVSGYQEANIDVQVRPEGTITIPQVGVIAVAGLTIDEATTRIRNKMAQTAYPNLRSGLTKLNVTLGKIRSIQITIVGAAKPGSYTVSSLTTVFNSLLLCGGPDVINTYREIELIRNNKIYRKIDLYQFLTRGDLSGNVLLKENDVINFPVYKKRVTITGQVKRPGIFEMVEGESLDKLLYFAGGFTDSAYTASMTVKEVTETERKIRNITKSEFSSYQPVNGNEIIVGAIPERIENGVSITGAVYRPGQFELTPGLTVSGLINKAGGFRDEAFMQRAILNRLNDDKSRQSISLYPNDILAGKGDVVLQRWDEVKIAYVTDFRSEYNVYIEGEVRKPGNYLYRENLSLKDVLFLAGSFADAGTPYNIEVSRRFTKDSAGYVTDSIATVYTLNVDRNLSLDNQLFLLKPFDIITVRRSPGYKEQKRVFIGGEVIYPGSYTITSKTDRISDLFRRAGGLTPSASLEGVSLMRSDNTVGVDRTRRQRIKSMQQSIRDTSNKVIEDIQALNLKIALDTKRILEQPGSKEDYVLEEGDSVLVAKLDPLVKISGEVLLVSKTNYENGRSLKYYIRRAGGVTDNARPSKSYVVYSNGQLDKTSNTLFGLVRFYPKIKPGSEIIIPGKSENKRMTFAETVGLTSSIASIFSLVIVTVSLLK